MRDPSLLLDEWAPKGEFDFEEFASYFPISNMFTLVGAPVDEVPMVQESLETLGLALAMDKPSFLRSMPPSYASRTWSAGSSRNGEQSRAEVNPMTFSTSLSRSQSEARWPSDS